jgi:hypothetical protein
VQKSTQNGSKYLNARHDFETTIGKHRETLEDIGMGNYFLNKI